MAGASAEAVKSYMHEEDLGFQLHVRQSVSTAKQ